MTPEEWRTLARDINSDIASMSRAIQTQGDVHNEILKRRNNPQEEQFIDEDAFGTDPTEPREIECYGAVLRVWKIHRMGLKCKDIKGADLYYEIADNKFVLIQYKRPNKRKRIKLDNKQLNELKDACPIECPPSNRFGCGSWYQVISRDVNQYLPACEAINVFGKYESRHLRYFINGLTRERFLEDFGLCRIGARTKPIELSTYRALSMARDRVIISAIRN